MSESPRTIRIDSEPEVLTDDNIPDHWTAITTTPISPPPPMKPETAHAILHWSAIDNKPANATKAIGWGTLDQPQDEHHDGSSGETGDEAEEGN